MSKTALVNHFFGCGLVGGGVVSAQCTGVGFVSSCVAAAAGVGQPVLGQLVAGQ